MKRAVIVGLAWVGILTAGCGESDPRGDSIDYRGTGARAGAGGRDGTGAAGSTPPGIGGIGGSGGTITPPVPPPLPPGSGGRAGGFGADGGSAAGVYTEAVVEAEDSPPPIAGGTLTITGQGHRAAVSDPDRDQVVVADLDAMTILSTIALARGDEPGRIVEDGVGRLHVALRGGRAVAVLDPTTETVLARLPVCVHPRGLAYDPALDAIHVACAGGELVSYTASAGVPLRKVRLERDLRDVVVDGNRLLVSRFRAAEILVVESNGSVSGKLKPPTGASAPFPGGGSLSRIAAVAWRTIASPDGGALMVYQLLGAGLVQTTPGGYGGSCGGIISTAVSVLRVDGSGSTVDNIPAVLPVDIATNPSRQVAVASAAWTPGISTSPSLSPYTVVTPPIPTAAHPRTAMGCTRGPIPPGPGPLPPNNLASEAVPQGRVVAIGYGPGEQIVVQTREPATLLMGERTLVLPGRIRKHTGHELFHLGTLGGLACASCHPEGHEDGQVWTFAGLGPRRTQSVSGGISGTEPFHWSGDMTTFSKLAHDVFKSRMSGPVTTAEHVESLFRWIDKIPHMESPAAEDSAAVERGRALFNQSDVGCASCHSGEKLTNNATVDVQTAGGPFQVPSLRGLAWRAPYMHTGCASTLADRFGPCGGGDAHGQTSKLTPEQRADLVAYLDTL